MSLSTPTTSRQAPFGYGRTRLPMAADGCAPQLAREALRTIATGRSSYASVQVKSRPATSEPPIVFM